MMVRRIDSNGRDVTKLPGLWSDEDSSESGDPSAMLGMVIVAGFASAFWFCVGLAIGWAM